MEALELILFLLAAVIASSILERFLPRLSLPLVQIALGALIAFTVSSPFEQGLDTKDFRFGRRHATLLEGEAFFNDVTGTVAFQCAIAVVGSGAFSLVHAGEEFALDLFGGLVGGAVMGGLAWALMELIRRRGLDNPTLHVTLELLLPFVIYLAAKSLHIGGVIAVVAAGSTASSSSSWGCSCPAACSRRPTAGSATRWPWWARWCS